MSNDEKAAAVGRMVERYAEASKTLATAEGEAQGLAQSFKAVGEALGGAFLTKLHFESDVLYLEPARAFRSSKIPLSDLNIERVKRLALMAREAEQVMLELGPKLTEIGVPLKPR